MNIVDDAAGITQIIFEGTGDNKELDFLEITKEYMKAVKLSSYRHNKRGHFYCVLTQKFYSIDKILLLCKL